MSSYAPGSNSVAGYPTMAGTPDPRIALMVAGSERLRLTFATFAERSGLVRSVAALSRLGVAPDRLGIAGRHGTIAALAAFDSTADVVEMREAAQLVSALSIGGDTMVHAPMIASPEPFWSALDLFGAHASGLHFDATWLTQPLQSELERRMDLGAVLLGVRADSPREHKASVRALLDHSSHRVMTFDFRR